MEDKTTIHIGWDKGGRISYNVSGIILPPPRDDEKLWVLAPSALFLLAHQFGSMKPSHGLIICGTIIDMLFDNRYVLVPINSALKSAMIDFIYTGSSVKVQFHPKQGMFANGDSVEEGVRQLINNYIHYAYTQIDEYTQLIYKGLASIEIEMYFNFIEELLKADSIGKNNDTWSQSFPFMSSRIIKLVSENWFVPVPGTSSENEQWIKEKVDFLEEQRVMLESKRRSLFSSMGLN